MRANLVRALQRFFNVIRLSYGQDQFVRLVHYILALYRYQFNVAGEQKKHLKKLERMLDASRSVFRVGRFLECFLEAREQVIRNQFSVNTLENVCWSSYYFLDNCALVADCCMQEDAAEQLQLYSSYFSVAGSLLGLYQTIVSYCKNKKDEDDEANTVSMLVNACDALLDLDDLQVLPVTLNKSVICLLNIAAAVGEQVKMDLEEEDD